MFGQRRIKGILSRAALSLLGQSGVSAFLGTHTNSAKTAMSRMVLAELAEMSLLAGGVSSMISSDVMLGSKAKMMVLLVRWISRAELSKPPTRAARPGDQHLLAM